MLIVVMTGVRLNMAAQYSRDGGGRLCVDVVFGVLARALWGAGRLHLTLEEEHPSRRDAFRHNRFYVGEPKPPLAGLAALSLEDALSKILSPIRADEFGLVLIDIHD